MSSQICTVTGIVLSARPVGEYDKLVTLLTKERGKFRAFARGARRPGNPLMAASNVFAFGDFQIYEGRSSSSISQADIQNYFGELLKDLEGGMLRAVFSGICGLLYQGKYGRHGLSASGLPVPARPVSPVSAPGPGEICL